MYDELIPGEATHRDRRQTERLLADQQAHPSEKRDDIGTFDTFAEGVRDAKTKLFRQAALGAVLAFVIAVVLFAVFYFPVQMSAENYHGDFAGILERW